MKNIIKRLFQLISLFAIMFIIYAFYTAISDDFNENKNLLTLKKMKDVQVINHNFDKPSMTIPEKFLKKAVNFSDGQISKSNIINYILYLENDYHKYELIESTYIILGLFMAEVNKLDFTHMTVNEVFINISETMDNVLKLKISDNADYFSYSIINRITDCDINSYLYLMVAHELNLPIYGILAPNHMLIRWDDGKFRKNFETINKTFPTDGLLMDRYNINSYSIRNNRFLRNLSYEEIISNTYFTIAVSYYEENDERAETVLKDGLKLTPTNQRLLGLLSHYYYDLVEDYEKSLYYINKLLKLDQGEAQYYLYKSDNLYKMKLYEEAIATMMSAYLINPSDSSTLWNLGWYYYKVGELEYAIAYSKNSIKYDNKPFEIYLNLGLFYQLTGDLKKSKYYYKEAFLRGKNEEVLDTALTDLYDTLCIKHYDDKQFLIEERIEYLKEGGYKDFLISLPLSL